VSVTAMITVICMTCVCVCVCVLCVRVVCVRGAVSVSLRVLNFSACCSPGTNVDAWAVGSFSWPNSTFGFYQEINRCCVPASSTCLISSGAMTSDVLTPDLPTTDVQSTSVLVITPPTTSSSNPTGHSGPNSCCTCCARLNSTCPQTDTAVRPKS